MKLLLASPIYDPDGPIPSLTRVLDRSRDALGRDSGVMVKDGSTVETSSTYAFGAADGRFTGVSAPAGTFTYGY